MAELADCLRDMVSRSIPGRCMRLHVMPRPRLLILHASSADFIRGKYDEPKLADRLHGYGVSLQFPGRCMRLHVMPRPRLLILHASSADFIRANTWPSLQTAFEEYGVSLHSREMYEAACNAKAEAVDITRELCRLHPGNTRPSLQTAFEDMASRSIPWGCMRLHVMPRLRLLILHASSADFIRGIHG